MNKEFLEGIKARANGASLKDNPYNHGTQARVQWIEGWEAEDQALAMLEAE